MQKSFTFKYTNNENVETNTKNTITFTNITTKTKFLGIYFLKVQNLLKVTTF
jgi:hypothetical protein